jgi:RimJ/RimL family protein N-acetyltransferase
VKDVDWTQLVGEGGIFLWITPAPMLAFAAALVGTDWIFGHLGLKAIHARVLRANERALRFDRALGYVFEDCASSGDVLRGTLTCGAYQLATATVRAMLSRSRTD